MYLGCSSESYSQALGAGRLTLDGFIRICGEELGLRAVELEDGHIGEPTPARLAELARRPSATVSRSSTSP